MSFFRRHPNLDDADTTSIGGDDNDRIDPDLRLRTVRTAASTLAESNRSESRREQWRRKHGKSVKRKRSFFTRDKRRAELEQEDDPRDRPTSVPGAVDAKPTASPGRRRNIYFNIPPPPSELDQHGEPIVRHARNKVRTSKYTPLTFLPKNLTEQFRRIANLYFLILVILSVFPQFGAAAPQISMLPLLFILTATAVKDGIEDYRRATLDDQVNNSAATKLGDWRNVNQPTDPRTWFERTFRLAPPPGTITKGIRKLRDKEAAESNAIVLTREGEIGDRGFDRSLDESSISLDLQEADRTRSLEDIRSVGSVDTERPSMHSYPPQPSHSPNASLSAIVPDENGQVPIATLSQYAISTRSRRSDGVVNWDRQTPGTARWERTLWKKLEVGDVVLLREDDQVPADIIVLSTSDANGLCYIETKNLDGETNLKPRKSLRATSSILSEEDLEHASFVLDVEPPHANLYAFNGVLKFRSKPSAINPTSQSATEKLEPVTINELLLRGCAVRNTKWIIGLVAFTGADTKIMMNGGDTPTKRSKIEKETNFNVVMNFIVLVIMCLIAAIANGFYYALNDTSGDFFYETEAATSSIPAVDAIITFGSALIAFQNIVPVSLFISIEIIKSIQAYFISQDVEMYYEALDAPCVPKTWNISDDLGQIEYIFSDKTGTLTQNIMEFQKCSVQGIAYGEGVTEAMRGAALREGREQPMTPDEQDRHLRDLKEDMIHTMTRSFKNRYAQNHHLTLISPKLAEELTNRSSSQRPHLIAFFRALALCHTVLADKPEPRERPYEVNYKAESPDESALVAAARDVGFPFVARSTNALDIEVLGQVERYVPLRVLEFNSTRKRMSVIVRNPDGKIVLYCKGADSVIYERLTANHDQGLKESTSRDLEAFANGGLRTLCVASRYLEEQEYMEWSRTYDAAASAIQDREEEIEKASELIERDLTILGATALEDKLQEGVPEAIETLHQAGIKLWILTGDKVQTAIEIGFSCNLLKNTMEIMILSADSADSARLQIEGGLNKIASLVGPPNMKGRTNPSFTGGFAVVIDGDTLRYALDPSLKQLFLNLGTQCDTVVCCRVSPAQKALTVKLVKEGRNAMTLSIGDGANDVAMIQEANIGCGLFGLEGSQAAMSADYAFGQFRFLTKLLLVHGRWSYQRVADMHSNFFYKNVIWTLPMFWFLIFCNFDATYLYQVTFILLYNVVFTSLPVIVLGGNEFAYATFFLTLIMQIAAFDQDLNAKASLAFPQLYKRGILGLEYTRTKFWIYMLDGFYQSLIVFWVPYFAWTVGVAVSHNGKGIDSGADFGTTVAVAAIFSANIFVGLANRYWTVITWVVIIGSMLASLVWIAIYSQFQSIDFVDEISILFATVDFWGAVWLSVVLAIAPRFIAKSISQIYSPLDKDIVREMWVVGNLKERLGIRHRYRKNVDGLEDTSLFPQEHSPELSEDERGEYEPVRHMSPPTTAHAVRAPDIRTSPPSPSRGQVSGWAESYELTSTPTLDPSPPSSIRHPASNHTSPAVPTLPFEPFIRPRTPPRPVQQPPSPIMSSVSPSALLHGPRSSAPGGEFEMQHVRTAVSSTGVDRPRTPQEVHPTSHDRYVPNPSPSASVPTTPDSHAQSQNPYLVETDDPPWGGDQRASGLFDGPRAL